MPHCHQQVPHAGAVSLMCMCTDTFRDKSAPSYHTQRALNPNPYTPALFEAPAAHIFRALMQCADSTLPGRRALPAHPAAGARLQGYSPDLKCLLRQAPAWLAAHPIARSRSLAPARLRCGVGTCAGAGASGEPRHVPAHAAAKLVGAAQPAESVVRLVHLHDGGHGACFACHPISLPPLSSSGCDSAQRVDSVQYLPQWRSP